jgi:hypothetical protein
MKLALSCFECSDKILDHPVHVEVEDKGVYVVVCPKGHKSSHTLSNKKFEILFEMGLLAFADGYNREAVTTFAAAVEEFYRHITKCIFHSLELYKGDLYYETEKFWKQVNVSERQLGAFAALYLLEFKQALTYPDAKTIEFRNKVVHKGMIPKEAEVADYAEKLLRFMIPIYKKYRGFPSMAAHGMDMLKHIEKVDKELKKASSFYPTAVDYLTLRVAEPNFKDGLAYAMKESMLKPKTPPTHLDSL